MNMEKIEKAIDVLNEGGIVIFPTDTAFGIGCRIDMEDSIERLFNTRRRPGTQATPVLVSGTEMAEQYLEEIPREVLEKLIRPYWPGALTIVLRAIKEKVPSLVRGGGDNLGVRMPDSKIALELIKGTQVPILGPSANFHGDRTPYEFSQIDKELIKKVDFVLEGSTKGNNLASTVIDCTVKPWNILRQGVLEVKIDL